MALFANGDCLYPRVALKVNGYQRLGRGIHNSRIKMVRCIVKCCTNNDNTVRYSADKISFFRLPVNEIIREGWLRKIGEVKLPPKIADARICSIHFSSESYTDQSLSTLKNVQNHTRRRRLLATAVPTLNLKQPEYRSNNTRPTDFNVIRKTVEIPIRNPEVTKKRKRSEEEEPHTSQYISSPTSRPKSKKHQENISADDPINTASNPWLQSEYRADHTPPTSIDAIHDDKPSTFPRRSQRLSKLTNRRRIIHKTDTTTKSKRDAASVVKEGTQKSKNDNIKEYGSEEGSPAWKRTRRFVAENFQENDCSQPRSKPDEDDPYKTIELLKAQLKYHQSLSAFYRNSKADDCQEYKVLEAQCARLGLEIKEKEDENKKMFVEITELKNLNTELHDKLKAANEEKQLSKLQVKEMVQAVLKPYFTEGQIRCIVEGRKWVKWSIDDYAAAISLRSISPKAYRYMRNKLRYPLPSLSSLRRWAMNKFDIREGLLTDVLAVMREKGKALSAMEKIAVLTFDEMALTPEVCFDSKLEKLVGPCSKVQVMMVRGLFGNWKQPIYYKFDQPMTKAILDEALTSLAAAGYQVVATTSDMGNKGVWGQLKITPDNHYFPHPSIEGEVVYVFADVPHLLKLLRNWLVDDGFFLHACKEKFTTDVFKTLVDLSAKGDLRVAHRITQRVLDARNTLRQAVWPAAQIWSHSAAKAIQWAGDRGLLSAKEYRKFADFILTVNSWFDVHNSLKKYGAHPGVNGFGVDLDQQDRVLLLMTSYVEHMRVGARKSLMPFQKGIIISNASLRGLYNSMKIKFPDKFEYLITRRLQQDILENFFSYIRAMGAAKDHPSGYEFRYRLRWYVLGKNSQAVFTINRNTEEDLNTVCMSSSSTSLSLDCNSLQPSNRSTPLSVRFHASEAEAQIPINSYDTSKILKKCETTSLDSEISATDCNCSLLDDNVEQDPTDEIILTQELFMSIINISPDELAEEDPADQSLLTNSGNDHLESQVDPDECTDEDEISRVQYIYNETPSVTLGCQNSTDVVQEAGLRYVAGYVAHRFRGKYHFLGEPTNQLADSQVENAQPDWVQTVSKGHLMQPSKVLMDLATVAEVCFSEFHGETFSKEDQVIQKVVKHIKNSKQYSEWIPEEVLQCLVRTRTYIRVREINKRMYTSNEQRKVEKKMKKLPKPLKNKTLPKVSPKI